MAKYFSDEAILDRWTRTIDFIMKPAGFIVGVLWCIIYFRWHENIDAIFGFDPICQGKYCSSRLLFIFTLAFVMMIANWLHSKIHYQK